MRRRLWELTDLHAIIARAALERAILYGPFNPHEHARAHRASGAKSWRRCSSRYSRSRASATASSVIAAVAAAEAGGPRAKLSRKPWSISNLGGGRGAGVGHSGCYPRNRVPARARRTS